MKMNLCLEQKTENKEEGTTVRQYTIHTRTLASKRKKIYINSQHIIGYYVQKRSSYTHHLRVTKIRLTADNFKFIYVSYKAQNHDSFLSIS